MNHKTLTFHHVLDLGGGKGGDEVVVEIPTDVCVIDLICWNKLSCDRCDFEYG